MKLLDVKGNYIGKMYYTDGKNVSVGDCIKSDKVYVVVSRVWDANVGEITNLIVREATPNDMLGNDE